MRPGGTVREAYSAMSEQYIGLFGDGWEDRSHPEDMVIIRNHLTGRSGPVLDLGCGPGHWTAHLHASGVDVTGLDMVPEFVEHARRTHPGPGFRLGSIVDVDLPAGSAAGVLSWYSTIHMSPAELDQVLAEFRRLLQVSGVLVVGFFDSLAFDSLDEVATFEHKVTTAYRWPAALFAEHLADAGFVELQRVQYQLELCARLTAAVCPRYRARWPVRVFAVPHRGPRENLTAQDRKSAHLEAAERDHC